MNKNQDLKRLLYLRINYTCTTIRLKMHTKLRTLIVTKGILKGTGIVRCWIFLCEHLAFIHNLINILDTLNNITTPTTSSHNKDKINVVQNNTMVLDYDDNWNPLLYKEAFHIERQLPSLNNGLKSSKELYLFS